MTQQQFDEFMREQRKQTALLEAIAGRLNLQDTVTHATDTSIPLSVISPPAPLLPVAKPAAGPNNPPQITKPAGGKRR